MRRYEGGEREGRAHACVGQPPLVAWPWWSSDRWEILFGRALAACVYPFATWRLCSTSWRLWILTAYAAAGYVIVLGALLIAGAPSRVHAATTLWR